jgi:hypothetical protein
LVGKVRIREQYGSERLHQKQVREPYQQAEQTMTGNPGQAAPKLPESLRCHPD